MKKGIKKDKRRVNRRGPKSEHILNDIQYKSSIEFLVASVLTDNAIPFKYEDPESVLSYWLENKATSLTCAVCNTGKNIFKLATYLPDFPITGTDIILEPKGVLTPQERRKFIALKEQHPEKDIRLIFHRDNWLTKAHKSRYSDWAEKYNIKYSIMDVPEEWIHECKRKLLP